jgi:hypothetical protein
LANKIVGDFYRLELGRDFYLLLDAGNHSIEICHPDELPVTLVEIDYVRSNLIDRLVTLIKEEIAYDEHCADMQTWEEE